MGNVAAMAWALVVVFGLIALAACWWLVATRSKLAAQRAATAAAETATATAVTQAAQSESDAAEVARSAAATIESLRAALDESTGLADQAAARADQAERDRAVDPGVLWSLERARSERTWRFSVAPGPDSVSALRAAGPDDTSRALVEAMRVELDAAREEVGVVVELDADVPDGVAPAGAVIALRVAQELLANMVRRSESTTLRINADGDDLVVVVEGYDRDDQPVLAPSLVLPPSSSIQLDASSASVRIVGAAARPATAPGPR